MAICTPDRGTANNQNQLAAGIDSPGHLPLLCMGPGRASLNQEEFRWGDLLKFLQRGYSGRYLKQQVLLPVPKRTSLAPCGW